MRVWRLSVSFDLELVNNHGRNHRCSKYSDGFEIFLGAIPPIAEMQCMFWISLLKGQVKKPLSPPHYHLLVKDQARIKYGVDHSTYMSTLARDIGASPGLWELWYEYGTKILVCYW